MCCDHCSPPSQPPCDPVVSAPSRAAKARTRYPRLVEEDSGTPAPPRGARRLGAFRTSCASKRPGRVGTGWERDGQRRPETDAARSGRDLASELGIPRQRETARDRPRVLLILRSQVRSLHGPSAWPSRSFVFRIGDLGERSKLGVPCAAQGSATLALLGRARPHVHGQRAAMLFLPPGPGPMGQRGGRASSSVASRWHGHTTEERTTTD